MRVFLEILGAIVAWGLTGYSYFIGWRDGFNIAASSSDSASEPQT